MKKLACLVLLTALSAPAWADCTYPKQPGKMPDGKTATRIVLGDWYEQGSVLRWDERGYALDALPRV